MIYYSHVNEDNRAEREIILQNNLENCVVVSGSGERAIGLLGHHIKNCFALDVNLEAQYLLELKILAIRTFSSDEYFKFTGHFISDKNTRLKQFLQIQDGLTLDCKEFWLKHQSDIGKGLFNIGHFEKFMNRVRPLNRLFLGKKFLQSLEKPYSECKGFPNMRWKFILWLFGQRWVYLLMGNKDIAFIAPDGQTHLVSKGFDRVLKADIAHESFLHHLSFNGHLRAMKAEALPPSLQTQILGDIKAALNTDLSINYYTGDLKEEIAKEQLYFDNCFYSVSDILSFVDFDYVINLLENIKKAGKSNVHLVLRSFLRGRIEAKQLEKIKEYVREVTDLSDRDYSGNYQLLHLKF